MQKYEPTIASGPWKYSLLFFFGFKNFWGERARDKQVREIERAGKTAVKMEKATEWVWVKLQGMEDS